MALDKPLVSRELLPGIIKRIIYNGYPLNAINLQGSLSDGAFRRLTQLAIWHYSDSFNVDESELTPQERWVYHQLIQGANLVPVARRQVVLAQTAQVLVNLQIVLV
ncbi:MAG: thioester domain-containing protein [Ligilactobacillus agilis]|nr:thioester domain-containing protein [Ligilactobacillus agilis]